MNKKIIIVIIVLVIIILGVWFFWGGRSAAPVVTPAQNTNTNTTSDGGNINLPATTSPVSNGNQTPVLMTSTGQLLTTSRYNSYVYEVYPTLDPTNGAKAMSGFALQTKDLGGGVTQVILDAKKAGYHTQTFNLATGQKLYFYERAFGDDSNDEDANFGDDLGIAVDAKGFILQ